VAPIGTSTDHSELKVEPLQKWVEGIDPLAYAHTAIHRRMESNVRVNHKNISISIWWKLKDIVLPIVQPQKSHCMFRDFFAV